MKESNVDITLSVLWGIGIAVLFKVVFCKDGNCVIIKKKN